MIKVKIVGASGYGGVGAIELLTRHPKAEITDIVAIQDVGKKISDVYPHLKGLCDLEIKSLNDAREKADVVFFSTPDKVGMKEAKIFFDKGAKIIDYSGDFRFNDINAYKEYARRIGKEEYHASEEMIKETTYGLCEIHRDEIKEANVVGNPGCFAVSAILAAYPALKNNFIEKEGIVFDAKTGVSGAGKKANPIYHFPHRYEEMNAYKIAKHQHVMEVERELSLAKEENVEITFTTQVLPIVRGIMTSFYAKIKDGKTYEEILKAYQEFYKNEAFVDVYDENESCSNRSVRGSNKAALWINADRRTNTLIVISHIDNLMKGQAANAVQNMNAMFGLDEKTGLDFPPMYP